MGDPKGLPLASEKYEVLRELGRGGMGVVYLARDLQLNREVALKVLYEHLYREHSFVERFREEARSVSTLHHPNIVCVHGLECSGDVVAIDMEYVEGQSLDQFQRANKITTHMVASIANDVLGGLATCHQLGVVHRDIKPSNILVGQESRAKITDFGLATAYASHLEATVQSNTSSGFYMGTPRYMPVQAWEGERPEPFWDLYSFGVVLFELLSGTVAFRGDNPMAIMRKQLTDPLPPLSQVAKGVSPEFCALVDDLLATVLNGDNAPRSIDAVKQLRETPEFKDLDSSNASATVTLPAPARTTRRKPRTHRRAFPLVAPAAVLLAALIGMAIWFGQRNEVPPAGDVPAVAAAPAPTTPAALAAIPSAEFLEVTSLFEDRLGPGVWMMERDANGQLSTIVGISDLELWSLSVSPPDSRGARALNGHWGAVVSPENRTAHRGDIRGELLWEPETGRVTAHLVRVRNIDRETTQFTIRGERRGDGYDREAFLRELESNAAIQGMLYQDLMPRQLSWAQEVEGLMPAVGNGRAFVPKLDGLQVTVDGQLGEELWQRRVFNQAGPTGELKPAGTAETPALYLRWTDEAVYLGARIPDCGPEPRLEIGLLPAFEMSANYAPRLFATLTASGLQDTRYELGDGERPWQFEWTGQLRLDGPDAEFELRIPLATLGEIMKPEAGRRWRVNAQLHADSNVVPGTTIVAWGEEDLRALRHGALIEFEGPPVH